MFTRIFFRLAFLLPVLLLSLPEARACGYSYVTWCANEMDFTVNGQYSFFYVHSCSWMNNFDNYNFGTVDELTLVKGSNNTWESCDNVVMNATIYYRIYPVGGSPGNFTALNLSELNLQSDGTYRNRTYYKQPNLDILAGLAGGNYHMEVYFRSDVDFNNDNVPDTFLIRDNGGAYYRANFTKPGGGGQCSISAATSNIQCNNNGTASNPNDDTYSFALTVTGDNTGNGWHTTINGQNQSGAYGTPVTLGPYPISGGNLNFTVVDDASPSCTAAVAVTPPPTCSNSTECSISAAAGTATCNDNGTPNDPADDTFTFTLTVTGYNTGGGWTSVIQGQTESGAYGTPVTVGPFAIADGDLFFTVEDDSEINCEASAYVAAPAVCSGQESCEKQVLFVVGVATPLGAGDLAIKNRLENNLDATVTVVDDNVVVTADTTGKDLVVVSATVSPTKVGAKFRDVTVPVLTWEAEILDDMEMTGNAWGVDYGSRKFVSTAQIANASHPMAAGLTGTPAVLNTPATVFWGNPTASAAKIAHIPNGASHWLVWGYETGAAMDGLTAPARRVGFFLHNTSATLLTADGWTLFDAAYNWSVNCSPGQQRPETADRAQTSPASSPSDHPDELRLYPNPNAGDLLMVDLTSHRGEAAKVVIGNALGQTIRAFDLSAGETAGAVPLHIEDLDNGQYLLSVQPEGMGKMSKLFFVQR